jgi:hypothetical protein
MASQKDAFPYRGSCLLVVIIHKRGRVLSEALVQCLDMLRGDV